MKKENFKVGDFIQIDRDQWSEYPKYVSGTFGVIAKIGNKYAKVMSFARTGLVNVEFNHLHFADISKQDELGVRMYNNRLADIKKKERAND